jgi:hypothetical protein
VAKLMAEISAVFSGSASPAMRKLIAAALTGTIMVPLCLKLGIGEAEVLRVLGKPSFKRGDRLIYVHEHQEQIKGVPPRFFKHWGDWRTKWRGHVDRRVKNNLFLMSRWSDAG